MQRKILQPKVEEAIPNVEFIDKKKIRIISCASLVFYDHLNSFMQWISLIYNNILYQNGSNFLEWQLISLYWIEPSHRPL